MSMQSNPSLPDGRRLRVLLLPGRLNGGGTDRVAMRAHNDLHGCR